MTNDKAGDMPDTIWANKDKTWDTPMTVSDGVEVVNGNAAKYHRTVSDKTQSYNSEAVRGAVESIKTIAMQQTSKEWEEEGDTEYAYDTIIHQARNALPTIMSCLNAQLEAADHIRDLPKMVTDAFPYQKTFNAIMAATNSGPCGAIGISVEKFVESFEAVDKPSILPDIKEALGEVKAHMDGDIELPVVGALDALQIVEDFVSKTAEPYEHLEKVWGHIKAIRKALSAQSVDVDSLRKKVPSEATDRECLAIYHYNTALDDVKALQPVDDVRVHDIAVLRESLELDCYDANLLGEFGGGNVSWWHDYIRSELERAHEFYQYQIPETFAPEELTNKDMLDAFREHEDEILGNKRLDTAFEIGFKSAR